VGLIAADKKIAAEVFKQDPGDVHLPMVKSGPLLTIHDRSSYWRPALRTSVTTSSAGPGVGRMPGGATMRMTLTWLPLLPLCVLFTLVGVFLLWLARRGRLAGQCRSCGYDLSGLASPTCPECGGSIIGPASGA
jgi:hypothetical protein